MKSDFFSNLALRNCVATDSIISSSFFEAFFLKKNQRLPCRFKLLMHEFDFIQIADILVLFQF